MIFLKPVITSLILIAICNVSIADIYDDFANLKEKSEIYNRIIQKNITEALAENGQINESNKMLENAVENKTITDFFILGNIFFNIDDNLSLAYMIKAENLAQNNAAIMYERAIQEHKLKNYKKAAGYYDKFFASDTGKSHSTAHALATDCYLRVKRYKDAIKAWNISEYHDNNKATDKLIFEVYGGEPNKIQRYKILDKIINHKNYKLFPRLIELDIYWEDDWWNSRTNQSNLNNDLSLANELLSTLDYDKLLALVLMATQVADKDEIISLLRETKLWRNSSKLPVSSIIAYRLFDYLTRNELATPRDLLKKYENELLTKINKENADVNYLQLIAFLYETTGKTKKLDKIDDLGWKKFELAKFAHSRYLRIKDKKQAKRFLIKNVKKFPDYLPFTNILLEMDNKNKKQIVLLAKKASLEFANMESTRTSKFINETIIKLTDAIYQK